MGLAVSQESQRRAADGFDFTGVFDLANASQLLAQNFNFTRELKIVGRVLVMAAATLLKMCTLCLPAFSRR